MKQSKFDTFMYWSLGVLLVGTLVLELKAILLLNSINIAKVIG